MKPEPLRSWQLSDFDFELPEDRIAQQPTQRRSDSRLLLATDPVKDQQFIDLLDLLHPGDVLVFNNSKVIPARLYGTKPTGGKVEILIERILQNQQAVALLRSSKKTTENTSLAVEGSSGSSAIVLSRYGETQDRFLLQFDRPVLGILEADGEIPLPPYISHRPTATTRDPLAFAALITAAVSAEISHHSLCIGC
ncbi:MAG: S-adenosylmethionine:tRNA ribosyltransferase-isomerase [Burkholderiaceae bacterium]